jgi:hypothetical protein
MEGAIKTLENQISTKKQSLQIKMQKVEEIQKEIENLEATLAILVGSSKQTEAKNQAPVPEMELARKISSSSTKQKEYYVIFNGPMKGVYDDWHKAAPHIQGKSNIIHKKYPNIEEAKKALNGGYAALTIAPPSPRDTKISLGSIRSPTIDSIETLESRMELLKITLKKYNDYMEILYNYKDQHKLLHFYPKYRDTIGYKAIVLPEASALTTYELFKNGLVDTIYFSNTKMLSYFPERIKTVINNYFRRFAKERACYMKIFSTHPTFNTNGSEDMPSYSVIQIGISNGEMPFIDHVLT